MKAFEIVSGKIVASDPCYQLDLQSPCLGVIDNVKKGIWDVSVEMVNGVVAVLNINHIGSSMDVFNRHNFSFDACVDSGQFGFFDLDYYRNDEIAKDLAKSDFGDGYDKEDGDSWYRAACEITLGEIYDVMPYGVVSSSGYGDGCYEVIGFKDKSGEWVGFSVLFVDDDDYEDDDYEDEDDDDDF